MQRFVPSVAFVMLLASACATGPEAELARVQGMNGSLAACLLENIDGQIDPARVVEIVEASVEPTANEDQLVTRAFINCIG